MAAHYAISCIRQDCFYTQKRRTRDPNIEAFEDAPPAGTCRATDEFVPTEQSQHASCRTLFIGIIKSEVASDRTVGLELFQLVGHSLRTLELRGLAGSFWDPAEALTSTVNHTKFLPYLQRLKVLDVGTWTLMGYLCAIWKGDGKRGPSGLIVHHDFELSRERDVLSVPVDILEKESRPLNRHFYQWSLNTGERAWAHESLGIADASSTSDQIPPLEEEDNRRPPLELYISRRSHVSQFILTLRKAKPLVDVLKHSVKTVDVWLKDRGEIGTELGCVIESWEWEHFIDRDVADGETTHSLLHEF